MLVDYTGQHAAKAALRRSVINMHEGACVMHKGGTASNGQAAGLRWQYNKKSSAHALGKMQRFAWT